MRHDAPEAGGAPRANVAAIGTDGHQLLRNEVW